jgi:hypothetical protein
MLVKLLQKIVASQKIQHLVKLLQKEVASHDFLKLWTTNRVFDEFVKRQVCQKGEAWASELYTPDQMMINLPKSPSPMEGRFAKVGTNYIELNDLKPARVTFTIKRCYSQWHDAMRCIASFNILQRMQPNWSWRRLQPGKMHRRTFKSMENARETSKAETHKSALNWNISQIHRHLDNLSTDVRL